MKEIDITEIELQHPSFGVIKFDKPIQIVEKKIRIPRKRKKIIKNLLLKVLKRDLKGMSFKMSMKEYPKKWSSSSEALYTYKSDKKILMSIPKETIFKKLY